MSDQDNSEQLTEDQLLVANHLINNIPMKDVINLIRVNAINRAQVLPEQIGEDKYNEFVEQLKSEQQALMNQAEANKPNEEMEEIPSDNTPSIIMP